MKLKGSTGMIVKLQLKSMSQLKHIVFVEIHANQILSIYDYCAND